MSFHQNHGSVSRRNNPFARPSSPSPATSPRVGNRPKSTTLNGQSPLASSTTTSASSHVRSQSSTSPPLHGAVVSTEKKHIRQGSRSGSLSTNTFAPSFIKADESKRDSDAVNGIEGENDFSGKRYVWLKDPQQAFVRGWIVEEIGGNRILVQCDDGSVSALIASRIRSLIQ